MYGISSLDIFIHIYFYCMNFIRTIFNVVNWVHVVEPLTFGELEQYYIFVYCIRIENGIACSSMTKQVDRMKLFDQQIVCEVCACGLSHYAQTSFTYEWLDLVRRVFNFTSSETETISCETLLLFVRLFVWANVVRWYFVCITQTTCIGLFVLTAFCFAADETKKKKQY